MVASISRSLFIRALNSCEAISGSLCTLPTFTSLSAQVLQQQELELLREATVKSQHSMEEGGKWIKAMLTSLNPSHNSGNTFNISSPNLSRNPYSLPLFQVTSSLMHYALGSIAEQTLSVHKGNPNQIMNSDKPLVQKDNKFYPQNPENKYISRYPVNYRGCLGCEDPLYLFQNCSRRNESSVRS